MRRIAGIFVFAAMAILLAFGALAQRKPYSLDDLQALDKTGAWDELRAHLRDVAPSRRGPQWNRFVEHACLRPIESKYYYFHDDFDELEACARLLGPATASEPNNKDFALRVATFFGRSRFQSLAVPFFARAITSPHDAQCASPELANAVVAGFNHSAIDEDKAMVAQAQRLAFDLCWPETRDEIQAGFNRIDPVYLRNTCDALRRKGVLAPDQDAQCKKEMGNGH